MKTTFAFTVAVLLAPCALHAQNSLEAAPPVVVRTEPVAGATAVDPALTEIRVTFSKTMMDSNWSWSTWNGMEAYPATTGAPGYLPGHRTCVLPVKLEPGKLYGIWLNSDQFRNFKDAEGRPALPYLLTFRTAANAGQTADSRAADAVVAPWNPADDKLNGDQRKVIAWTDRQFRSFFDQRSFTGWSAEERAALETRLVDALKGPQDRDYYVAINTLGALRSTNALAGLRAIAFDRRDKNNRDRWMAIRALGGLGDKESVPELIHLVYHGNVNTHWWAQISLVWLTGQNFGSDWKAWGKWWNESGGQPPYKPEIIKWWSGQPEEEKLAETLAEGDKKFFDSLEAK